MQRPKLTSLPCMHPSSSVMQAANGTEQATGGAGSAETVCPSALNPVAATARQRSAQKCPEPYRSSIFCGALPRNSSGMWVLVTLSSRTRCCRRFFSCGRAAWHVRPSVAPNHNRTPQPGPHTSPVAIPDKSRCYSEMIACMAAAVNGIVAPEQTTAPPADTTQHSAYTI